MFRIERGRSLTKETRLSIASVAREAGVSTALIHNHYPGIADAIRQAQGRDNRTQRDAKTLALKEEKRNAKALRQEVAALRTDVARLSSINEVLTAENAVLRAKLSDPKIVELVSRARDKTPEMDF
ncbi:transcriptional regulator, TetR family [Variovorax sp. YR266]|nr:transcriptional regulator, TetR family [Variovorax sp. YR266]